MEKQGVVVPELTLEERERIKQDHAHRYPELRYFPKPGDDGKPIKLPIVIGNPSGACTMPAGAKPNKAWADKVYETFGGPKVGWTQLVMDCILWPAPHVLATWMQRWPALVESIKPALVSKYGGDTDQATEPTEDAPEAIASARAGASGSTWMRFQPKGATVDLVIKAPSSSQWAMFSEAMKQPGADHWSLVKELADAVTVASSMPEAYKRWPGLVLQVDREASYLAGLGMAYEEGEL